MQTLAQKIFCKTGIIGWKQKANCCWLHQKNRGAADKESRRSLRSQSSVWLWNGFLIKTIKNKENLPESSPSLKIKKREVLQTGKNEKTAVLTFVNAKDAAKFMETGF